MDAYYAVVSVRAVREFSDRPIGDEALNRILEAGRASGSSRNTQPWQFIAVRNRELLDRTAGAVFAPENLTRCQAAIAIVSSGKGGFDVGRCAQNMMIAAWADGIGSVPNGIQDADLIASILALDAEHTVATVISFGYPMEPAATSGDAEAVLKRIKRHSLESLTRWID